MGTCCSSIWADRKTSLCVRSLTHLAYKMTYLLIKILELYIALAFCLSSSFIRTQWFQLGLVKQLLLGYVGPAARDFKAE